MGLAREEGRRQFKEMENRRTTVIWITVQTGRRTGRAAKNQNKVYNFSEKIQFNYYFGHVVVRAWGAGQLSWVPNPPRHGTGPHCGPMADEAIACSAGASELFQPIRVATSPRTRGGECPTAVARDCHRLRRDYRRKGRFGAPRRRRHMERPFRIKSAKDRYPSSATLEPRSDRGGLAYPNK